MGQWYPNGLGQVAADALVVNERLHTLGATRVFYVHHSGVDANNTGEQPERPFATLGQGVTSASNDDIIVLMSGHSETPAGLLTVSEKLTIIGGGSSAGQPTVSLTAPGSAGLLALTGTDIEIRNIKFPPRTEPDATVKIAVTGANVLFRGCRFECDGNDDEACVGMTSGSGLAYARFENCTFVSTATSATARPFTPLMLYGGSTLDRLDIIDCVFDGGAFGFDTAASGSGRDGFAAEFAGTITRCRVQGVSMLRSADIKFGNTPVGWWQAPTVTGSSYLRGA